MSVYDPAGGFIYIISNAVVEEMQVFVILFSCLLLFLNIIC